MHMNHQDLTELTPEHKEATNEGDWIPISEPQREIWLSSQISTDASCAYHQSYTLTLSGVLQRSSLEAALNRLVARHEALRLRFAADGDSFCIEPSLEIDLAFSDLASKSDREVTEALLEFNAQEANTPFNFVTGPLLRAKLTRLKEEEHQLRLTLHHIICDDWSAELVLEELGLLYSAISQGREAQLPEADSYVAHTLEQTTETAAEGRNADTDYWLSTLKDAPASLDLPASHSRPATKTFRASTASLKLESALADELKKAAQGAGMPLENYLLGAYQAYLSRLSGKQDLVVGRPFFAQALGPRATMVGHCAPVMPIRARIDKDTQFSRVSQEASDSIQNGKAHAQTTGGAIISRLGIPRDPSRMPVVSVLFRAQEQRTISFEGLTLDLEYSPQQFSLFEWDLCARYGAAHLDLRLTYNTDLFDADLMDLRLLGFAELLRAISTQPAHPVSTLPVMGVREEKLVRNINETDEASYLGLTVKGLFEAQVKRTPEAPAVLLPNGDQVTYAALNAQANQLAHYLRAEGASPEKRIGVCVDRGVHMLVALLAIVKSGAAYVPIDPEYPKNRVQQIAEDADLCLILANKKHHELLGAANAKLVCPDDLQNKLTSLSKENPRDSSAPDDVAYLIYTSGSTGRPKGVEIQHAAFANFILAMADRPGLQQDDVLLAVTTLSFDIAGLELFLPLIRGAAIALADRQIVIDGKALISMLETTGTTVMQATPATWRLLIDSGWKGSPQLRILCGGEALPETLAKSLLTRSGELWNMYGPTETTVWSTIQRIKNAEDITIGKPIANTQIAILDPNLQPVPIGVPGELFIGGTGLARGYRDRVELTAEKFIESPFPEINGRLYRTGDLARFRADGELECMGRLDHQVKIRGHRIELGEIESALDQCSLVDQAAVIDVEREPGIKDLAAYLTISGNASREELIQAARSIAKEKLPAYMVPQHFIVLETLPLTPNGKVDRKALPPTSDCINELSPQKGASDAAPKNDMELLLTQIFEEILGTRGVQTTDDFFEIGGHSLLAVRLIAKINETCGADLPVGVVFANSTIRALVAVLKEKGAVSVPMIMPLASGTSGQELFCCCGINLYRELGENLAPEYSTYGVYAPIEDKFHSFAASESVEELPSVEEVAAAYIEAIREVRPSGPYHIAGVSFGGIVAYEVARQLHEMGEDVGGLFLIDAILPSAIQRKPLSWVRHKVQVLREKGPNQVLDTIRKKSLACLHRKFTSTQPAAGTDGEVVAHRDKGYDESVELYEKTMKSYAGPATVFYSTDRSDMPGLGVAHDCGWTPHIEGELQIQRIDADHLGALCSPAVNLLAKTVRGTIEVTEKSATA